MHPRIAAVAATFLISCTITFAANAAGPQSAPRGLFEGTQKEHAACNPDSTKFCLDVMPNQGAVLACLQKHRSQLRKACRKVLESHGE